MRAREGLKASDLRPVSCVPVSDQRGPWRRFRVQDVSRHKSMDVLQAYVRDADLFRDHAGAGLP
jgi:hypothetical protein